MNDKQIAPTARIYVETIDGRVYAGETVKDAINALRASAWGCTGAAHSMRAYMEATARRVGAWNKRPVRSSSIAEFVEDMEAAGLIVVRRMS